MSTAFGPKGALFATTLTSGAQVQRGRGIKYGADLNHGIHGTANSGTVGCAYDNADVAERPFRVIHRAGETVLGEAGAAVAAPSGGGIVKLTTDAVGRWVTATTGQLVGAYAREAASAAGELFVIEIAPPGITG